MFDVIQFYKDVSEALGVGKLTVSVVRGGWSECAVTCIATMRVGRQQIEAQHVTPHSMFVRNRAGLSQRDLAAQIGATLRRTLREQAERRECRSPRR